MDSPQALRDMTDDRPAPRLPWPVLALIAVNVVVFLAMFADAWLLGGPDWRQTGGTSALAVRGGLWWTLLTSIFLHGGLAHIGMNMAALASLGAAVSQRMGPGVKGALWFYGFFLVCGLVGSLTFVALNWNGDQPMIGASGAIFGVWAAWARIGGGGSPTLLPALHPYVRRQVLAAVVSNLIIIALFWFMGALAGEQTIGLAWEAHLGGFVAGFFLVGPFLRLARRN